ncbi:MAG: Flagellar biosynthesis protein FlgN [Acidimicrobiaceae bacterium]|nr:Flagellar biosynthesis protein FlgN [Acidimicrobiaceae bacterium]
MQRHAEVSDQLDDLQVVAMEEAAATILAEAEAAALVEHHAAALGALLAQHGARYLALATSELEETVEALTRAGDLRRSVVCGLAPLLGISLEATLADLAAAAPPPYGERFLELRLRLLQLRERITDLGDANTELLGRRMTLISEALREVTAEESPTYGRPAPTRSRFVRGVL